MPNFPILVFIQEEGELFHPLVCSSIGLIATRKATRTPPFGAVPPVFASLGGRVLVFVVGFYLVGV